MTTIQFTHDYVLVSPCARDDCPERWAISRETYDRTRRTGELFYCPRGHGMVWTGKTVEQELESARARQTHLLDQLRASVEDAERSRQALARDRHRFANGVCPCCNRSFPAVAAHMATEHPGYDPGPLRDATGSFECSCGDTFPTFRGLRVHQGHRRSDDWQTTEWEFDQHLTVVSRG